jgi:hypothetical protein
MANAETRTLALVSQVKRALARACTLEDLKRVRDDAETIRSLAQKAKLGLEVQNEAAEFKLRAERKAGEMLSVLTRRGRRGTKMYQTGTFRLDELGISRNQSSRWQKEAAVSEEEFSAFVQEAAESGKEVSAERLLRLSASKQGRRKSAPRAVDARREGEVFVVPELLGPDRSSRAKQTAGADNEELHELLAELRNHHATLSSMLLPFLEQTQATLAPPARRHSAQLLHEISSLHEALEELKTKTG